MTKLITFTKKGIYCEQAAIYIDPTRKVERAIITHGHADHARPGHQSYLCHHLCAPVLKLRLGKNINIQSVEYGEKLMINGVAISLHPAGHIVGSAQVRLEYKGEIWVVTGDYKTEDDGLSGAYEVVKCNHLITECTFGLPIYRWQPQQEIFKQINKWWRENREMGITSILFGYSLGKSQRLIQGLDQEIGNIFTHNTIENVNATLREAGVNINPTTRITSVSDKKQLQGGMLITPPSGIDAKLLRRIQPYQIAMASGWMTTKNTRRGRMVDRGFVLSDHVDWTGINEVVNATETEYVVATHGFTDPLVKWLKEKGLQVAANSTNFSSK